MLKAAKFAYFLSLTIFMVLARFELMFGFLFRSRAFSGEQFKLISGLFLFAIGLLVLSWFPKNPKVKRVLENASLVMGAFFFRAFSLSEFSERTPVWANLLFVTSFGLFLFFKLAIWFNRKQTDEDSNEAGGF